MEIGAISGKSVNNTLQNTKNNVSDDSFEKLLKNASENGDDKELKKACSQFESIMLNMMYKQMKASIPKSDLLPTDSGRDIFEGMLDDKLMEEVSSGKGLGLGDILYKQLSRQLKK